MKSACPSRAELRAILECEDPSGENELDRHVQQCAACQRALEELSGATQILGRLRASVRAQDLGTLTTPRQLGDFELERVIGKGGMGVVWEARQLSLGRQVAVKLLSWEQSLTRQSIERFRREAEAGARINHEGIVSVLAVGEHEGHVYLVQELVENGYSLQDFLTERRAEAPLGDEDFRASAELFVELCRAIQAAHEAGVIHRDIKPSNILLTAAGRPKIADFGLARVADSLGLSQTGQLLGTPFYMSPEQARPRLGEIDHRTDIFSLGATLYEALTLRRPFEGDTSHQVLLKIAEEEPPDPRQLRSRIPVELATICLKALEKEPARRYATAAEMGADLTRWLQDEPIRARPSGLARKAARWCRRHPVIGASALTVILSLLVISQLYVAAQTARMEAEEAMHQARESAQRAQLSRQAADETAGHLRASQSQLQLSREDLLAQNERLLDTHASLLASGESSASGRAAFYSVSWLELARRNLALGRLAQAADCLRRSSLSAEELERLSSQPAFAALAGSAWKDVFSESALADRRELARQHVGRARRYLVEGDQSMALRALFDPIVDQATRAALLATPEFAPMFELSNAGPGQEVAPQSIEQKERHLLPLSIHHFGILYGASLDESARELLLPGVGEIVMRCSLDGESRGSLLCSGHPQRFEWLLGADGASDRIIGHGTNDSSLQSWRRGETGEWEADWYRRHELPRSPSDVAVGDLDADGRAEILIGYLGSGLELRSPAGELIWSRRDVSAKCVCIASLDERGTREAFALGGRGLEVLDRLGETLEELHTPVYGEALVPFEDSLLIAGAGELLRLRRDGRVLWRIETPGIQNPSGLCAGPSDFLAITGSNRLLLLRATDGELLATVVYGEPQPTRTVSEPAFASDGSGKVRLFVPTHFGLFTYLLHE